ncbi:MAG TPA: DUF2911 domain-containing protein [Vicinamibacterales bacterium]|nr:DUF2911 domain-containing protein [Vicinamibacterales bacterium]
MTRVVAALMIAAASMAPMSAQQDRPLSPPGTATAMVAGEWTKNAQGNPVYQGGKWIEVEYSRPMLRQRENIFGSGADYGKAVTAGAPVWRAGANNTTVFRTDVPLSFSGKTLPAGEYGLLVDLKEGAWTLILTSQARQKAFDANNKTELIGAVNYDPKFDVVRVPMEVGGIDMRLDQLTIFFADVTRDSGVLGIAWDKTVASVPFTVVAGSATGAPAASGPRPLSPPGTATAMVGGEWVKNAEGTAAYQGGKWIEIVYSRPMLRQRENIFGAGADYGKAMLAGAPVWRVGANQMTRIKTEAPLAFGGKTLPAGEYGMFVDLKEGAWTLIFSSWPAQQKYDPNDKTALWGGYGYTADKDVLRVPMELSTGMPPSIDQLTIFFCDVQKDSGKLAIAWDDTIALAPFTVNK